MRPVGFDAMARSLAAGERRRIGESGSTICDALQAAMPGKVPFAVAGPRVKAGVTVADALAGEAVREAFRCLKSCSSRAGDCVGGSTRRVSRLGGEMRRRRGVGRKYRPGYVRRPDRIGEFGRGMKLEQAEI